MNIITSVTVFSSAINIITLVTTSPWGSFRCLDNNFYQYIGYTRFIQYIIKGYSVIYS